MGRAMAVVSEDVETVEGIKQQLDEASSLALAIKLLAPQVSPLITSNLAGVLLRQLEAAHQCSEARE
ncbi:hypothetical protein [Parachitinimonas caeni]|uniref:Uncharacterized protein n=1 Tax=Parachitinimonas caeni TaxID=3031301 RepID=A0ABT7DVQ3_9NEIS|nr:hypothetical protein [Parachitinimonas caeni]MDK2124128.1 hypothetical protein [Parachitinimonas caeni]